MMIAARVSIALVLTAVVLPFLYGYFFFVAAYVAVSPFFFALAAAGWAVVFALTRSVPVGRCDRLAARLTWVLSGLWLVGSRLALQALAEPHLNGVWLWLGYVAASFWYPWLGWLWFRKDLRPRRYGLLLLLLAVQALFPLVFRIEGATGQDRFIVDWRARRPRPREYEVHTPSRRMEATRPFPQYQGPNRDLTLDGPKLARNWKKSPPQWRWRRPVGQGWGGFAVVGASAVTQEQRPEGESVVCYDLADGSQRWIHTDPVAFTKSMGGPGPRSTPAIGSERVYSLGATGLLQCLDLHSGRAVWRIDASKDNGPGEDDNGMSSSPLLEGDRLWISPTGKSDVCLACYDATDGEPIARTHGFRGSYSSPVNVRIGDSSQVLVFHSTGLAGCSPHDAKVLWNFPWDAGGNHCVQPLLRTVGDELQVLLSANKAGAVLLSIGKGGTAWNVQSVWEARSLKTKFSTAVRLGDFVYGLDEGILACIEWNTGDRRWKDGRYGHGQMLLVGRLLLILSESGELALLEPDPAQRRELGRIRAIEGKTWNTLALVDATLLVRNSQEAACIDLPVE